jgi:hypothetical protein
MADPLTEWIFHNHPALLAMRGNIEGVLATSATQSLDEIVIGSNVPVRNTLLILDHLIRAGKATIANSGKLRLQSSATSSSRFPPIIPLLADSPELSEMRSLYEACIRDREEPVLLWGQRRLVPRSAFDRAIHIMSQSRRVTGNAIFLGDDDLVSPVLAACLPRWKVHVVDIDRMVLAAVTDLSSKLGGEVSIEHADLTRNDSTPAGIWDVVVTDPFPSGDGSFEGPFWQRAVGKLKKDGLLVTTVGPSHKPREFAAGALHLLRQLGFETCDMRAASAIYEVFPFEFVPYEQQVLESLRLSSTVSHTKATICARRCFVPRSPTPVFDLSAWQSAAQNHYLTVQAGIDDQRALAAARGPSRTFTPARAGTSLGLRIDLLASTQQPDARDHGASCVGRLLDSLQNDGAPRPSREEAGELERLERSSDISEDGPLAQLGLAIRAIESWTRWRLDD